MTRTQHTRPRGHPARIAPALLLSGGIVLAVAYALAPKLPRRQEKQPNAIEYLGEWGERGDGANQLSRPQAIASDPAGLVYIPDAATRFVHKFSAQGEPRLTFLDPSLKDPTGIAVDRGGAIYVVDSGRNRVNIYFPDGKRLHALRGSRAGLFRGPSAVTVDDDGNIYVVEADANRVQKFSARNRLLNAWGRRGPEAGEFFLPAAIAVGQDRSVYVGDAGNNRIEKFTTDGNFVALWDCSSTGAAPGTMAGITGVAVSDNYVFGVVSGSNRLLVWTLDGRRILDDDLGPRLDASAGKQAAASSAGPQLLHVALGLALSGRDHLLVLDPVAPRVLRFRLHLQP